MTTKTTKTTRQVVGTVKLQGIAHWHRPKEWAWPQFDTNLPWAVKEVDLDNGIMTIEFYQKEGK